MGFFLSQFGCVQFLMFHDLIRSGRGDDLFVLRDFFGMFNRCLMNWIYDGGMYFLCLDGAVDMEKGRRFCRRNKRPCTWLHGAPVSAQHLIRLQNTLFQLII
jgi:hypothetical protein